MGVDHGLGGRDNLKSKKRREKKAKKVKSIALKALRGGKKGEIVFDENSRQEFLTGFRKRKQERRKYGLAMELLKKQKEHKEFVKSQRNAYKDSMNKGKSSTNKLVDELKQEFGSTPELQDNLNSDEEKDDIFENENNEKKLYDDPSTVSMFGSSVSVVINDDIDLQNGEQDEPTMFDREEMIKSKQVKTLSRLEKALKKANSLMNNTKKPSHNKSSTAHLNKNPKLKKKVESSKLLKRAVGNSYKGKRKKK